MKCLGRGHMTDWLTDYLDADQYEFHSQAYFEMCSDVLRHEASSSMRIHCI